MIINKVIDKVVNLYFNGVSAKDAIRQAVDNLPQDERDKLLEKLGEIIKYKEAAR